MSYYKDTENNIHDDMNGEALLLSSWPKGLIEITDKEAKELAKEKQPLPDVKDEAKAYLSSTDWYVIRYAERSIAIPDDVAKKRAASILALQKD